MPSWITDLAKHFKASHAELFVVGGAIRNQLLGKEVGEWDMATSAHPEEIEKLLRSFGAKQIGTVGKRFGTITAIWKSEPVEITTYRTEQYDANSRQPIVKFGNEIKEDLSRRDFTINAIAYDPIKEILYDPFNGQIDLESKVVQSVGSAEERFSEDPLRMLRAIRFMTVFNFAIEPETLSAITAQRSRFSILSAERIAGELNKILLSEMPSQGIRAIVESGLIDYILPELKPCIHIEFDPHQHKDIYGHILQVLDQTPPKLELRWCALLHDIAKPQTRKKVAGEWHFLGHEVIGARTAKTVLRRLKYSNEFVDYVGKLVYLHQRIPNDDGAWTDGAVRRFVRDAGSTLEDLFSFAAADSTGNNQTKLAKYAEGRRLLQERVKKLEEEAEIAKIKSPLSGEELMRIFNRPAGPWIKPIKEKLLAMVLDGELKEDDKISAEKIAKEIIDQRHQTTQNPAL